MGGVDHQPTTHASKQLTVPMERAVSQAGVHLFAANARIEDVVLSEQTLSYGAGRGLLEAAIAELNGMSAQMGIAQGYARQMLGVLGVGDYEPFHPATSLDLDAFLLELMAAGLVPDTAAAREAVETLRGGSYVGAFESYVVLSERLIDQIAILHDLTVAMRDGQAGLQGLFWHTVEANRQPWRQAFALVLTQYTTFVTRLQTVALVSTETFLLGTGAPGLLTNVREVTLASPTKAVQAS